MGFFHLILQLICSPKTLTFFYFCGIFCCTGHTLFSNNCDRDHMLDRGDILICCGHHRQVVQWRVHNSVSELCELLVNPGTYIKFGNPTHVSGWYSSIIQHFRSILDEVWTLGVKAIHLQSTPHPTSGNESAHLHSSAILLEHMKNQFVCSQPTDPSKIFSKSRHHKIVVVVVPSS